MLDVLHLPSLREAVSARGMNYAILPSPVAAFLRGCKGGLIATAVMTLYRLPAFRALPPTSEFWAQHVSGGDAEDHPVAGWLLHLLYGAVGGGVFGVLFTRLGSGRTEGRELLGVVSGLVYGVVLSVFGTRVIFPWLLDEELDTKHRIVFHVGHVVYGLTLGTWLGSREGIGEAYHAADER